jgi:hypothetical protein
VKFGQQYYGFSDVNSSIYEDSIGNSDAWVPIEFRIKTNNFLCGAISQKIFGWFSSSGAIWPLTTLNYSMNVDNQEVFQDSFSGDASIIQNVWEIGQWSIGDDAIGGGDKYFPRLTPFDKTADEGRVYRSWIRAQIEITSASQIQDFILDILIIRMMPTMYVDQSNKF